MKPKTLQDIIKKAGELNIVVSWPEVEQFLTTEIKEMLNGLKGEEKDELQLNEKPKGFIGDYVKEMERIIGSNQRESLLREDIEEVIK